MGCFCGYSACRFENGRFCEYFGEDKQAFFAVALREKLTNATFYTDHHADIPLARAVKNVWLVSPDKKTVTAFLHAGINAKIL
jgi:phosphoserine phosphatase